MIFGATGIQKDNLKDDLQDAGCLTIPNALFSYNNTTLYQSYLILESQLSKIKRESEPELYAQLDTLTQKAFDMWVSLGYREGCGCGIRV